MNRAVCTLCVVGLATAGALALGAGSAPPTPQPAPTTGPADRTLVIPAGNYSLLVFTNHSGMAITAAMLVGAGEMAFTVPASSTVSFPLGKAAAFGTDIRVVYKGPVAVAPASERAPTGVRTGTLSGWGAADGTLVAFVSPPPKR